MYIIEEKKATNESYYVKTLRIDGKKDTVTTVYPRAVVLPYKKKTYYLLYNSDMQLDYDAFTYINITLSERSRNTMVRAHEALKFLEAFQELIGKNLADFLPEDITALKYFLHGYNPTGMVYEMHLLTVRSNATVNGYLSVYRRYLQYLKVEEHPLFDTTGSLTVIPAFKETSDHFKTETYRSSERKPSKPVEVPAYISVDEFLRVLKYVRKQDDLEAEIIIRLMYQCGMRLGEVLGLTADDLVMEDRNNLFARDGYTYSDDFIPIAYIRNRVSDNYESQNAKSCLNVISRSQYKTSEYNQYFDGYQFVVVPQDLFDLIDQYINTAHTDARERSKASRDRYFKKTIADRVRDSEEGEGENYYIFLNSVGTPLMKGSWNNKLRKIFEACNLEVDKKKRKNNLNHRFRHGYAMFNVQYCHVNEAELADLLRHKTTAAVKCYYKPTKSDQIALKTASLDEMYNQIPGLKRDDL